MSLFQKLKATLDKEKIIVRDINNLEIGDFVEIEGTLKTNPLIDMLSSLKVFMILVGLFSDEKSNKNKFNAQIDGLIKGLQADGKNIICKAENMSVILPTDEKYF